FFQAEDGIRDDLVTGVQTCALPILPSGYHLLSQGPVSFSAASASGPPRAGVPPSWDVIFAGDSGQSSSRRLIESLAVIYPSVGRSAERRVGKERSGESWWSHE